jgi:hypothetical protein
LGLIYRVWWWLLVTDELFCELDKREFLSLFG